MDAVFFLAPRDRAVGVTSSRDLPVDPVAEPLRIEDPSPILGLAGVMGIREPVAPLRDATCRSFPVWEFGPLLSARVSRTSGSVAFADGCREGVRDQDPDVVSGQRLEEGDEIAPLAFRQA